MTQYNLQLNNLPNQTFTTTIDDIDMEITLNTGGTEENPITFFSLKIGEDYLCPAVPVCANQGILPYPYMVSEAGGNFIFITENDAYPYYTEFEITQFLNFITTDEFING